MFGFKTLKERIKALEDRIDKLENDFTWYHKISESPRFKHLRDYIDLQIPRQKKIYSPTAKFVPGIYGGGRWTEEGLSLEDAIKQLIEHLNLEIKYTPESTKLSKRSTKNER